MRNKLNISLAAIFVLTSIIAGAQEKRNLNLHDAIQLSIQNSHQLKSSKAKIDEATAALQEAVEQRLPEAKVSGSYLWLNSPNIDMKSKNSGNGGSTTPTETPKVNQAVYGLANLSLPIYTGGKIKYGIESSRYLAEATKLDADYQREEVIQNTIATYINLFKSKSAVDLVKESLAQSQQRVKEFSSLEKNGLLARNDLLKAELQESNKELALLDAQNNWQLANINMNLLLGLPEHTELVLDSTILDQAHEVKPLDDYIQSAIVNRKDIASIDLQKKAALSGVRVTKGDLYPSIALTGGYIAADIPNMLSITNAVNAGVGVSYNISSIWKTKSKVQQAEAKVRQVNEMQGLKVDQMRREVNKSYLDWLSTQKKLEVYEKAVVQANENYRITKNKYDNSLATTTDLLDADVAQLQARVEYVYAKADAIVIYNDLLKSAGVLNEEAK